MAACVLYEQGRRRRESFVRRYMIVAGATGVAAAAALWLMPIASWRPAALLLVLANWSIAFARTARELEIATLRGRRMVAPVAAPPRAPRG